MKLTEGLSHTGCPAVPGAAAAAGSKQAAAERSCRCGGSCTGWDSREECPPLIVLAVAGLEALRWGGLELAATVR